MRGITMGVEGNNKALTRRFYAEIDTGNIEAMDEIVAEDYWITIRRRSPAWGGAAKASRRRSGFSWEATPGRHWPNAAAAIDDDQQYVVRVALTAALREE